MASLPIGLLIFAGVIFGVSGGVKLSDYMNLHSVLIVFVGSLAVLLIGNPWAIVKEMFKLVAHLFAKRRLFEHSRDELMRLAANRGSVKASNDSLINYAISLWERGVDTGTFQALLSQYRDKLENDEAEAHGCLTALSKYPPALGMMGTVIGMISLFANLGSSDKAGLGPALATAMTATFYGLLAVNMFLNPLADRVAVEGIHRKKYYGQVYEILTLINRREPAAMIEEEFENRVAA